MKIEKNKYVSLLYELRENDSEGRIIEEMDTNRPLSFVFGCGRLIPGFEKGVDSLEQGDDFSFIVDANDAYGERREEMIVNVPITVFQKEGKLDDSICYVGNTIPMSDTQGRRLDGVVNEIADDHVKMDFNHPMAGSKLHFSGKVVEVRDATDDELAAVNPNSSDGCSGCSSSSDSCGGEC